MENVGDLWALERASVHHGLYHVLGGTLSALGAAAGLTLLTQVRYENVLFLVPAAIYLFMRRRTVAAGWLYELRDGELVPKREFRR